MRSLILLALIFNLSLASAGTTYFISPFEPPFLTPEDAIPPQADQSFSLWSRDSGCYTNNYTVEPEIEVNLDGNEVRVFNKLGQGGNTVCVSPTPPRHLSRAQIEGLAEGNYNLSYYVVPFEDAFPPAPSDYPTYLITSFQFGVVGAPAAVDSTTNVGLALLTLLMLLIGLKVARINLLINH